MAALVALMLITPSMLDQSMDDGLAGPPPETTHVGVPNIIITKNFTFVFDLFRLSRSGPTRCLSGSSAKAIRARLASSLTDVCLQQRKNCFVMRNHVQQIAHLAIAILVVPLIVVRFGG